MIYTETKLLPGWTEGATLKQQNAISSFHLQQKNTETESQIECAQLLLGGSEAAQRGVKIQMQFVDHANNSQGQQLL